MSTKTAQSSLPTSLFTSIATSFAGGLFTPLTVPNYRRLFSSNSLWWTSVFMEHLAMGWMVLELTNSAWLVSMVGFFRSLPLFLFGFLAGPINDYVGRRKILVITSAIDLCSFILLTLLVWWGILDTWQLYIIAFVLGCMWGMSWPARRGILPDLVGKERTVDVLLIERIGQGAAKVVGPATAGFIVAGYGMVGCFAVMAFIQVLNLSALWAILTDKAAAQEESNQQDRVKFQSPIKQITEGFAYVRQNPVLLSVVGATMVANMFIFPYGTLLPIFARDILGQGPVGLGWLGAASGFGTFGGLWVITMWRRYEGRFGNNGSIFTIGTAFLSLVVLIFAVSPSYWLSWIALFSAGIGQACFALMQSAIMMLVADDGMRNRMMGMLVISIGMGPFGKLLVGALAENYGAPIAVASTASVAFLLIVLITAMTPQLRRI
ncbi:MAG: MFS transporter [Chloroflexota bacterium]